MWKRTQSSLSPRRSPMTLLVSPSRNLSTRMRSSIAWSTTLRTVALLQLPDLNDGLTHAQFDVGVQAIPRLVIEIIRSAMDISAHVIQQIARSLLDALV